MNYYRAKGKIYIKTPLEYPQYEQITEEEYQTNVPQKEEEPEEITLDDALTALERLGVETNE